MAVNMDDQDEGPDELQELVEFLSHDKEEVRKQAVEIVAGVTGSEGGSAQLGRVKEILSRPLLRLIGAESEEGKLAATALVNLSPERAHAEAMIEAGAVNRVMDNLRSKTCDYKPLLAAILSNISIPDSGAKKFLQVGEGGMEGVHLGYLVFMLVSTLKDANIESEVHMDHLAGVLPNIAKLPDGARLLTEPGCSYIKQLIPQLKAASKARREGTALMLKNICLHRGEYPELMLKQGGIDFIPSIIQPLSGETPREGSDLVREGLAGAVQVLASTPDGLDALLAHDAHARLRTGYADEEHRPVLEAIEITADYFLASGRLPEEYHDKSDVGGYATAAVVDDDDDDVDAGDDDGPGMMLLGTNYRL